jgi:nucleoside-diphosphate-sugar epimerase
LWLLSGTQDLLEACFDQNVPYLIYTSSVNSVLGMETVTEGTEKEMPKPQTWFWGGYGETKWYAEQVVLDADNIPLLNGGRLRTLCLRPTTFYGENDAINVPRYLATAQRCGGKLWRIGGEDLTVQQTYVGNVAWAHLAALEALLKYPEKCAGEAFFVTDNTPAMNVFSFVLPFLEDHGLRLSSFRLPFALVYFGFMVFIFLLNAFRKFFPDWKIPKSVSDFSLSQIAFLNMKASFCRNKAEDRLTYQPLFSFEESIDRSRKYYKHQE